MIFKCDLEHLCIRVTWSACSESKFPASPGPEEPDHVGGAQESAFEYTSQVILVRTDSKNHEIKF